MLILFANDLMELKFLVFEIFAAVKNLHTSLLSYIMYFIAYACF